MTFRDDLGTERAEIMHAVRSAGREWAEAMRSHKLAPPDAGFAGRLQSLADAAQAERQAWERAHAAGLLWRPIPGAEHAEPPYELRPGTGRRGPAEVWTRFDLAVGRLNRAIAGSDAGEVAAAFGDLAGLAARLAEAVSREDRPDQPAERARGAA
jgi:hypothetical protein